MDDDTVLETFDQHQLIRWNTCQTTLLLESLLHPFQFRLRKPLARCSGFNDAPPCLSNFSCNLLLHRYHVPLPSGYRSQTWLSRLYLHSQIILIDADHLPSLSTKNEFGTWSASSCDKVLVEAPDATLPEEVEDCVPLDICYDREILE